MRLYNVEIFTRELLYRSSCQVSDVEYEIDYLAITSNKIKIPSILVEAMEGDFILLRDATEYYTGIVTSCNMEKGVTEITYKPLMAITDITVHFDRLALKNQTLEEWLADTMYSTFGDSGDILQDIHGFVAVAEPATQKAVLSLEENIGNLHEILKEALLKYNVTVDFDIDVKCRRVIATIQVKNAPPPVIEADLPNIQVQKFTIRQAGQTVNKLTVYNSMDDAESMAFYMLSDGEITTDSTDERRVTPIKGKMVYISHDDETTFAEAAYEKAFSSLQAPDYNNLIELTVTNEDTLVHPKQISIGQRVKVRKGNKIYSTVLTAKKVSTTTKLVFGAVRLELTKMLKGRFSNHE